MAGTCQSDTRLKDPDADYGPKNIPGLKSAVRPPLTLSERFLNEINEMRKSPSTYAAKINEIILRRMNGNTHSGFQTEYFEGKDAFKEVQTVMRMMEPLPELNFEPGLVATSYERACNLAKTRIIEAADRGTAVIKQRIEQYGSIHGEAVGECSIAIHSRDPVRILIELLADDGIVTRRNRMVLLDARYRCFGCALVKDSKGSGDNYIVMHFAEHFEPNLAKPIQEIIMQAETEAETNK